MKVTVDPKRIVPLLLSLPGVVALFLPFMAIPTMFGMWYPRLVGFIKPNFKWDIVLLAPLFLPIPIVAWQVRRLLVPRIGVSEVVFAYAVSAVAMLLTLIDTVLLLINYKEAGLAIVMCWLLMGGNVWLLARNLKLHIDRGLVAEVLLMGSYISAAIIPIVVELLEGFRYTLSGLWLTAMACIAYVFLIVRLLRRSRPVSPVQPTNLVREP